MTFEIEAGIGQTQLYLFFLFDFSTRNYTLERLVIVF